MWKIFLVISSVVLLGSLYLANENRKDKLATLAEVATQKDTLAARSETLAKTEAQIAELGNRSKCFRIKRKRWKRKRLISMPR
jgi:hypothetical protein